MTQCNIPQDVLEDMFEDLATEALAKEQHGVPIPANKVLAYTVLQLLETGSVDMAYRRGLDYMQKQYDCIRGN